MSQPDQEFYFEKFHGALNDFIFISASFLARFVTLKDIKNFVKTICHRHQGIGADGVVFYFVESHQSDQNVKLQNVQIFIVNSDGSFASTCGNALRCLGLKLLQEHLWDGKTCLDIGRFLLPKDFFQTRSVLKEEQFVFEEKIFANLVSGKIKKNGAIISIAMKKEFEVRSTPFTQNAFSSFGKNLDFLTPVFVRLENPHWVFVSSLFSPLSFKMFREFGLFAQNNLRFRCDKRIPISNIAMVYLDDKDTKKWTLVVYERGAGLTPCCGSGAIAARVALEYLKLVQKSSNKVMFKMPGGLVFVSKLHKGNSTPQRILTGPAHFVFSGTSSSI